MKIVPITQRDAKAWIDKVHRHLDPPVGDIIRVALTANCGRCGDFWDDQLKDYKT